jgi:hypothetical protein
MRFLSNVAVTRLDFVHPVADTMIGHHDGGIELSRAQETTTEAAGLRQWLNDGRDFIYSGYSSTRIVSDCGFTAGRRLRGLLGWLVVLTFAFGEIAGMTTVVRSRGTMNRDTVAAFTGFAATAWMASHPGIVSQSRAQKLSTPQKICPLTTLCYL